MLLSEGSKSFVVIALLLSGLNVLRFATGPRIVAVFTIMCLAAIAVLVITPLLRKFYRSLR